jgi:hypothetical protein
MNYDSYNREERYICAHLFRLLHEPADHYRPLREFIGDRVDIDGFRIYVEVALIRDAYHARRCDPVTFVNALVQLVKEQEEVTTCRIYSELLIDLRSPKKTHPREIRLKGQGRLTKDEQKVYGAIQGMFNAKPDILICVGQSLFVYEAKLTLDFDQTQLARTQNIAKVWAKLLHRDLGFLAEPQVEVRTLGLKRHNPTVSWEKVREIADGIYMEQDRTRLALANVIANNMGDNRNSAIRSGV